MTPKFCIRNQFRDGSMLWTLFEKRWYGWAKIRSYGWEDDALEQLSLYTWRPGSTYYDSRGNQLESEDYSQRPKFCTRWSKEYGIDTCVLFELRHGEWIRLYSSPFCGSALSYLHFMVKGGYERYYDAAGNEIEQSKEGDL